MNPAEVHPTAFIFVGLTIGGALLSVLLRNILHAVFGLGIALAGIAGLFLYLDSAFLAAMQVLIYVGGISVAMVFAVMMAHTLGRRELLVGRRLLAAIPALGLTFTLALVVLSSRFVGSTGVRPDEATVLRSIGKQLLTEFNVAFEALSVVLLLAIIGAIVVAKERKH
ncbi:MAG: NADH-quinone oxidoreductase subunit J [Deltaproteobacteria bacterium]|nr:NADH-quinone oxidoreductase subunit J [Deltaproteobacteria bacterium]